ncbi:MAG: protein kinase [Bryobacteraceae bacterium]
MTPERYRRINEVTDEALELPHDRRAGYLESACASDAELRSAVERLLMAHGECDDFLARPAVASVADAFIGAARHPDLAGRLIGRYRMQHRIGAGGHGEVWLAEDVQLGRPVAVKLLSPECAGIPGRAANLYREARMSSSLNHPNIVTIYDTGEFEGIGFIAQEFVAGETLRSALSRAPMALRDALHMLIQVASALESAHNAGIVHCDIKPENVILRGDGLVKVLDFGLAGFARENRGDSHSNGAPSFVMGTLKYMAPEQVRGGPADVRTDLFSFGIVLYEALSGNTPFTGDTTSEIVRQLIESEPAPLSRRDRRLPRRIDRIVERLLAKDPDLRYQSVAEVRRDLLRLSEAFDARRLLRWLAPAAAIAFGFLALVAYRAFVDAPSSLDQIQVSLVTPPGVAADAAISPDGLTIAYILQDAGGAGISLHRPGAAANQQVLPAARVNRRDLTFAPDGQSLYYVEGAAYWSGALYRIALRGGTPVRVFDHITGRYALAPDGRHFAFIRLDPEHWAESLIVADSDGHAERIISTRYRPQYYSRRGLSWAPDGASVACLAGNAPSYTAGAFQLIAINLATGAEHAITKRMWAWPGSVTWSGDGQTILVDAAQHSDSELQLWRVSYRDGAVQRITNDVSNYQRLTQTSDSRRVLAVRTNHEADLWVARANNPAGALQVSAGGLHDLNSALLAPGGRLFFSASSGDARNIWTMNFNGLDRQQITAGESSRDEVAISRDGRHLSYQSDGRIWSMNSDGSRDRQLTNGPLDTHPTFSADGNWILYTSFAGWSPGIGGQPSLWRIPVNGGNPQQLTRDANSMADVSPDGKWIAAAYYRYDHPQQSAAVAIYPFSGGRAVTVIERPAGADSSVFWSADGNAVEYVVSTRGVGNIWRQNIHGGSPAPVTDFRTDGLFFFNPSADRNTLVLARGKDVNDLVLIRGIR